MGKKKRAETKESTAKTTTEVKEERGLKFTSFCMQKQYSDCTLKLGKTDFPAHRFLLAAQSTVLAKLLYPSDEKDTSKPKLEVKLPVEVTLDESTVSVSVLIHFLHYCYMGAPSTRIQFDEVMPLQTFAEHYKVNGLLSLCAEVLENDTHIDVKQAVNLLKSDVTSSNEAFQKLIGSVSGDVLAQGLDSFSESMMLAFLSNPFLLCEELDLFKAIRSWAKAECRRQKLEYETDNEKKVLKEILPKIRFPLMEIGDLSEVAASELIDATAMIDLFQYKATQNDSISLPFSKLPRDGCFVALLDRANSYSKITIEKTANNACTVTHGSNNEWRAAVCAKPIGKMNKVYVQFTILKSGINNGRAAIALGVTDDPKSAKTCNSHLLGTNCHCMITSTGNTFSKTPSNVNSSSAYCTITKFAAGTVVGLLLDSTAGSMEYFVNGVSQGLAFKNVKNFSQLYPYVGLFYGATSVQWDLKPKGPSSKMKDVVKVKAAAASKFKIIKDSYDAPEDDDDD
eukprot:TRINITY_DN336_c0_g1_i1.p1 TRINITY_DN336_c0_g1~~TRINITY_DN336_c0_g1_i1.p1  ORF type:complete len:511 (+),score=108.00 TRINITY_DN336_c0_g1_i1:50-1582(+)